MQYGSLGSQTAHALGPRVTVSINPYGLLLGPTHPKYSLEEKIHPELSDGDGTGGTAGAILLQEPVNVPSAGIAGAGDEGEAQQKPHDD